MNFTFRKRRTRLIGLALFALTLGSVLTSASPASAQFGFGRGFGRGFSLNLGIGGRGLLNRGYGFNSYNRGYRPGFYNRGYGGFGSRGGIYNRGYRGVGGLGIPGAPIITPPTFGPSYYGGVGGYY